VGDSRTADLQQLGLQAELGSLTMAMRVTAHQTIAVFQRYRIVSDDDVRAALARTQAALGAQSGAQSRERSHSSNEGVA
jgi:hypothetical protein